MDTTLQVLILEDDASDAELAIHELRATGLDFVWRRVETRSEFLEAMRTFRPDIVLSDYKLPRFDGLSALRIVLEIAPTTPLILLTGSTNEETAVECMKAGATDYVLKDRLGRLGQAVRSALERRSAVEARLRAEAGLLEAETRARRRAEELEAVLDAVPAAVLIAHDAQARRITGNRAAYRLLRMKPGENPSKTPAEGDPPSHFRVMRDGIELPPLDLPVHRAASWGVEIRGCEQDLLFDDGTVRHLIGNVSPLLDESQQPRGAVAAFIDVTDRNRTQEEIRKLSLAVEQSPATVLITNTKGDIEYVNPKFTEVTGYSPQEVLAKNPRLLKSGLMPPEVYEALWATITSGGTWRGEFQNRRKDGTPYWEDASISAIRDSKGVITHYIAVKEDITERKRSEEALQLAQRQLLQAQKMEAVGRLAGGVAHDFNNLLGVIYGYGQMLLEPLAPEDPSRGRIREILKAAERAAGLTRQLLAFSRRQVLEKKVLNVVSLVTETEKMLKRLIGEDVELTLRTACESAHVLADAGQIEQVLMNLAVNARDAMPHGGKLTLEVAEAELDESYASGQEPVPPGPYVMLAVTDSGTGMDKETRSHLFEPFFTTKEPGKGTGLGLATVYGIVRQSGGCIFVYSEIGVGTTFRIYLPRAEQTEATEAERPASSEEAMGGHETVLVVEDDDSLRLLVREVLEGRGYAVLVAKDSPEALQIGRNQETKIDLLLTDIIMHGLGGRELAARLVAVRPSLKVLYMSGYTHDTLFDPRHTGSSCRLLQKPFGQGSLARAVREALDCPPQPPHSAEFLPARPTQTR